MSSDLAIRCEGLGKQYLLPKPSRTNGLSGYLSNHLKEFTSLAGRNDNDFFWALSNVSFEARSGQVLGIVGRNGSGKSTLLKILSGVTLPTEGRVELRGRIGSLLEVGTGFHPDMTGRENIFMAGALLGLSKAEIGAQFDEIVDFSGVERFLDTPVKRYSSGMYVRLAFSVAAILRTDILIVDEALSVGDAAFQEKCLRRIRDLRNGNTTIILVSHDLNTISTICDNVIILNDGKLIGSGPAAKMAVDYQKMMFGGPTNLQALGEGKSVETRSGDSGSLAQFYGDGMADITDYAIFDASGDRVDTIKSGAFCRLYFKIRARATVSDYTLGFAIRDQRATVLYGLTTVSQGLPPPRLVAGKEIECWADIRMWLAAGKYFLTFGAAHADSGVKIAFADCGLMFTVQGPGGVFTDSVVNLDAQFSTRLVGNQLEVGSSATG